MPNPATEWWNGYMMNWFPFMGFLMMLFWLIVLIAIAYLVYRLVSGGGGTQAQEDGCGDPERAVCQGRDI